MKIVSRLWASVKAIGRVIGATGRATVALIGICGILGASANYLLTQPGSGTSFASVVISTVHYAAGLVCDATVGQTQCAAVKAASTGAVAADPALVTTPSPNGTQSVKSGSYVSAGTQQNALAIGTNTQLTVPSGSVCAEITVEGASIRRTSDTTSATTTNGTLIQAGAQWQDCGPLAAYKFTAVSGSPTIDVEYYK
jgi:hypothetical protein